MLKKIATEMAAGGPLRSRQSQRGVRGGTATMTAASASS